MKIAINEIKERSTKNCFITPHISWTAIEGRQRLGDYSLDNLKNYLNGTPTNIVNL